MPTDTDGDGLSDEFERQLGTRVYDEDTDGDKLPDGVEVATHNLPRVRGATDATPDEVAHWTRMKTNWERDFRGGRSNANADGDEVADWIEARGGTGPTPTPDADRVHNPQPLDVFIEAARSQHGKPYQLGAKADLVDPRGARTWDSSELVEWAAHQAGLRDMPDGSWEQYQYLHRPDVPVSVKTALETPGALLFRFSSDPAAGSRPTHGSVAISMGDGRRVIEVSERTREVKVVEAGNLYKHGAFIPELHSSDYDLDGDFESNLEERLFGGDVSRDIKGARPTAPSPTAPPGSANGPRSDLGIPLPDDPDPLGADRYQRSPAGATDDPTEAVGYGGDDGRSVDDPAAEPSPGVDGGDDYGYADLPSVDAAAGNPYAEVSVSGTYTDDGADEEYEVYEEPDDDFVDESYDDTSTSYS
jgi:cell wall-associated NlpC family hydrolase